MQANLCLHGGGGWNSEFPFECPLICNMKALCPSLVSSLDLHYLWFWSILQDRPVNPQTLFSSSWVFLPKNSHGCCSAKELSKPLSNLQNQLQHAYLCRRCFWLHLWWNAIIGLSIDIYIRALSILDRSVLN